MLTKAINNIIETMENNENFYNLEFLAREYFEMHKDKCDKCQKYRVECAFSPYCTDRRHLNILIQLNTDKNDRLFPTYCYSLYVKNLKDYFEGKETITSTNDSWIYLEDFLDMFKKKIKDFKKKDDRSKFMKLVASWKDDDIHVLLENKNERKEEFNFMYKDAVFRINFLKGIIIVDVNHRICHTDDEIENYLHLLRSFYRLESHVKFVKAKKTLWYIKYLHEGKNQQRINEKLAKRSNLYHVNVHEAGLEYTLEIKTSMHHYLERKIQNYSNLKKIFKLFREENI